MAGKKRKNDKGKEGLKLKKLQQEFDKEIKAELKALAKADPKEFQKGVVEQLGNLYKCFRGDYKAMNFVIDSFIEQREMIFDHVRDLLNTHEGDVERAAVVIAERIGMVEFFSFALTMRIMMHLSDKPMSNKWKKDMAGLLSVDLKKMSEDFLVNIGCGSVTH